MSEPVAGKGLILVTGATGFVGSHVVEQAILAGHPVIATGRKASTFEQLPFSRGVRFIECDLHKDWSPLLDVAGDVAALIHLAWPDLPDFRNARHVSVHLGADARFVLAMLDAGLPMMVGVGTCLEYGIREGALVETMRADPQLPYPIAKDTLRRLFLPAFSEKGRAMRWARLFYMYGPRQNARSLLSQLDHAIAEGKDRFPMSGGQQVRDYLPVEEVARRLVTLAAAPVTTPAIALATDGIFNICSGQPQTVEALVRNHIAQRSAIIEPELGVYPYPDYEPMSFWGETNRFTSLQGEYGSTKAANE
jgi:nucleoside-diphosphate-sugar epimerase